VTLILRRVDSPVWVRLRAAGRCRVSLCEILGAFGSGPVVRVVFLGSGGLAA
jgi:hypothetical protein